jgi:hypothetical protein|nr:MAG TPA: hypothetical protein [Caudoviricetes sp.]
MTQEKITLALREALLDWFDLKKIEEKFPKSSVARNKAQRKWNEVEKLAKKLANMLQAIEEAK